MARNVNKYVQKVFTILDEEVKEDTNRNRIINTDRKVFLSKQIYEFIKKMKWVKLPNVGRIEIVNYEDNWYVCNLNNKKYLCDLVTEAKTWCENALTIGLIASGKSSIATNIKEINIVDSVLGVKEEECQVETLKELFSPQTIYSLGYGFKIFYQEDLIRLICLLEIDEKEYLTDKTREYLKQLLFLESSRCIAELIVNIYHTHDTKLIFLQLYRMMEYLFMVQKAIEMSKKYSVDKNVIIKMLCEDNAFWQKEEQHVVELVSTYAGEEEKDRYFKYLQKYNLIDSNVKIKNEKLANYIYRRRCQIAHFKYRQESIQDENILYESNERLAELVCSMYRMLNNDIVTVNSNFNTWSDICYEKMDE